MNISYKMVIRAAAACLFLGGSNAAMAVGCPLGFIANETVEVIDVNTGGNCLISNVLVLGSVTIRNGADVVIKDSRVFGHVKITNTKANVSLFDNEVVDGNVIIDKTPVAYLFNNTLLRSGPRRIMTVQGVTGEGLIFDNVVEEGTIRCKNNAGNVIARSNIAASVECVGQIN